MTRCRSSCPTSKASGKLPFVSDLINASLPVKGVSNDANFSPSRRGAGENDGTVYGQYDEAAWHGQEGHQCPEHYPLCAFTARQIMDEYRKYVSNNETFKDQQ